MKKTTAIIFTLVLAFVLAACSGGDGDTQNGGNGGNDNSGNRAPQGSSTPDNGGSSTPDNGGTDSSGSGGNGDPAPSGGNADGVIVAPGKYGFISPFYEGKAVARVGSWSDVAFTAIDTDGNELFPPIEGKYTDMNQFAFGVARVVGEAPNTDSGMGEGLVDINGNEIVPLGKYHRIYGDFFGRLTDTVAVVDAVDTSSGDYNVEYGVIDNTGREVVPLGKYNSIGMFSSGVAVVRSFDNEYSIIDKQGSELVPFGEYDTIHDYSEGFSIVYADNYTKWGILDTSGNLTAPLRERDNSLSFYSFSDGVAVIQGWDQNDGVYFFGTMDSTGEYLITPTRDFSRIWEYKNGAAMARNANEEYGIIDKSGNEIVPFGTYNYMELDEEGFYRVYDSDNNSGCLDSAGNLIIPIGKYAWVGAFRNGYMSFQVDERNIVIDSNGTELYNEAVGEGAGDILSVSEGGLMVFTTWEGAGVVRLG